MNQVLLDLLWGAVIGIIQGIVEWLPISSEGQLVLVMINLLGISATDALSLAIYSHFGTLLAVVLKYKRKIRNILLAKDEFHNNYLKDLVISTVFTGIVGLPLYVLLKIMFGELNVELINGLIGVALVITGILLIYSQKKQGAEYFESFNDNLAEPKKAAVVGAAQGFSIIPGISRSGTTFAALVLSKFNPDDTLEYSFLMSVPAVMGAILIEMILEGMPTVSWTLILSMVFTSFVMGYLTMNVLLLLARNINKAWFVVIIALISILAILPLFI